MALDIGSILAAWEAVGVFDYALPFLLVFAVVFGILSATKLLGDHKGMHILIAFVIGLLSLQWGFVPEFFRELFPRLGVGLAVMLVILILVGLFISDKDMKYWGWGLGALGFFIAIVVIFKSMEKFGWTNGGLLAGGAGFEWILLGIIGIGLIIAVASSGNKTPDNAPAEFVKKLFR
ncbi:MAG: hypothetical protein AABW80_03310 [Nanoarchaeota archaeon]